MFKRLLLLCAAVAILSASSTAMARYPYRMGYRGYYPPAPVVRAYRPAYVYGYSVPRASYYAPYSSYYVAPPVRRYYAPAPVYVPTPVYGAPYGGVSVDSPGVSLRIGF
ncbi:hypothetical protein Poly24_48260 [Rosistilla carotiformis]|uniref:Uncharacterized protein n=1 Tax=Rosistilla carotiformis TaxID=2528017 RepID=A0A518JZW8_9BACT|nr:hypothetical protein [Rosistilla carotiformis]QDV71093.1 hypothetical protein Poly24_48260 [Rosistilla carotiformis]